MESLQSLLTSSPTDTHPSRFQWDRYLLQQLPTPEHSYLHTHLQTCSRCQHILRSLQQEQRQFSQQFHIPSLVHKVITAPQGQQDLLQTSAQSAAPVSQNHLSSNDSLWQRFHRWLQPLLWTTASVSAGILVVFLAFPHQQPSQHSLVSSVSPAGLCPTPVTPDPGIRRKGSPSLRVYLFRQGTRTLARSGSAFYAGDVLALRYQASGYRYLSVMNLDAQKSKHWLYPSQPGSSIPIASQGDLQGSIELDQAKGTEYLLAFFSSHPLRSQDMAILLQKPWRSGPRRLSCSSNVAIYLQTFTLQKP